jgi:hypothetical protein
VKGLLRKAFHPKAAKEEQVTAPCGCTWSRNSETYELLSYNDCRQHGGNSWRKPGA